MPDTPTIAEPGKPRRRWYQFRLRTLLMGVVRFRFVLRSLQRAPEVELAAFETSHELEAATTGDRERPIVLSGDEHTRCPEGGRSREIR